MTQISIDPTVARSVAQAIQRASDQLDSARSGLSHQWASLDANWEGGSKAPVEGSVRSALGDLTQAGEQTYDLGAKLEAIAQRFEAADEAEGMPLMQILWGFLLGGALAGGKAGAQTLPEEYDKLEADIQDRIKKLREAKLDPKNSKLFNARGTQEILEKRETIETLAKRYNVDPALLAGVLAAEKDFDYTGIVSDFDYTKILSKDFDYTKILSKDFDYTKIFSKDFDYTKILSDENLKRDQLQDILGQLGVRADGSGGLGMASVRPDTLDTAIQYLNHPPPEGSPPLVGAGDANAYDKSPQHRTSFEGSAEGAAIVLAMLNHAKGGAHSAEDMAVVWGGYRAGVKGLNPPGVGFESVTHFVEGKANSAPAEFQMGTNAYMSVPYFEFFKKKFAS